MDLVDFFTKDIPPKQRQYEVLRAIAFKEGTLEEIAQRFGYKPHSLRTLVNRLIRGKHRLFPEVKRGPKGRRVSPETEKIIITLRRKKRINSKEITEELRKFHISIGVRTVERVLQDAGFPKLRRRTNKERGITKKGTLISKRSSNLDFSKLEPFRAECQVAGVFFFLPYIIESGIIDIVENCDLPESSDIGKKQAALSMLLLKLIGNERLSHIKQYDTDLGFGIFTDLNVLPKPTFMCSYSCRTDYSLLMEFQSKIVDNFRRLYPDLYQGKTINLDFHAIPHFGDESEMEKVWCGTKNKVIKGANTFFAQDSAHNSIIYANADIKRSESSSEIKSFVNYWITIKGIINETLVFDSKLTRYDILYELDEDNIKFITLRKRCKNLIEETENIPESDWEKIYLPIPKRKRKHVKVFQNYASLIKGEKAFRQIIVRDHGRAVPTYIITNNENMKIKDVLIIYAKRWHIENKLAELIKFFKLNALSSPLMIRIHFDLLWTIIADTIYHRFAKDLKRFENSRADKIFKQFIDMPGQIEYDGESFNIKIRKRATTPILLGLEKLKKDIYVPWLNNKTVKIIWIQ